MKRGLCALILFCFCIFFSVYGSEKNKTTLEKAKESINEIIILCENREYENALKEANRLKENWFNEHSILKITLNQNTIYEIEKTVISVPFLIADGNVEKAEEECLDAVFEIDYLLEKEKLIFKNIF